MNSLSGWADFAPLIGFVVAMILLWRLQPPPPVGAAGTTRSPCAVVIPARNEAISLPTLLASLTDQLRPGDELVVVNDHSTDDTAAIAERCGARVVEVPDVPDGWWPKSWACWNGALSTSAPLLVFVDADVSVGPGGLDRIVAVIGDDLVSVQPFHRMATAAERVSLFPNITSIMGAAAGGWWAPRSLTTMAFGPVLAVSRQTYEQRGGHEAIRTYQSEDIGMARLVGSARCFAGRDVVSFRMYPEGWRQVLSSWVRSLRPGLSASPWWMTLLVGAWMAALLGGPFAWWGWYVVSAAQLWWAGRRIGSYSIVAAVAYPLLAVIFVVVVRSVTTRSVTWRGRTTQRL
jgi:4,4'-diaponeurosporenoate glycosyltransferase